MKRSPAEITQLLQAWSDGDPDALGTLLPLVFDDLHRMAVFFFQRESKTHTLQPTALVNELYLRLNQKEKTAWQNREEFFAFAVHAMRCLLVDYSRYRGAQRRGRDFESLPVEELFDFGLPPNVNAQFIDVDRALSELAEIAPRQARIVELRFVLGLQVSEVAEVMDLSESTVKREWRTAKVWLARRLTQEDDSNVADS